MGWNVSRLDQNLRIDQAISLREKEHEHPLDNLQKQPTPKH